MIDYSIVIPVYNGEKTVEPLFTRLKQYFSSTEYSYEIIFVYDNGNDNSWDVLLDLKKTNLNSVKIIKLSRNYGQHNALICGFEHSKGAYIVTMDEDLQHDPFDISELIKKQKEKDYDITYGKYDLRKHSVVRNLGSSLLKKLITIGIPEIHSDYSAFRLIKSNTAKATIDMKNSYTFLDGYLSWITTHCNSCIVTHSERYGGESSYSTKKLINHTINIFVTFSDFPIKFLRNFSLGLIFTTFCFAIYIIGRKILFDDFALGFPSLILSIGFSVGFIMLSLSIIGEYIYRINLKTTKRPNYHISEIL